RTNQPEIHYDWIDFDVTANDNISVGNIVDATIKGFHTDAHLVGIYVRKQNEFRSVIGGVFFQHVRVGVATIDAHHDVHVEDVEWQDIRAGHVPCNISCGTGPYFARG